MAFDWGEYLKLAEFLVGKSGEGFGEEASARCAVSRAYYAAFCHARDVAQAGSFRINQSGEDHKRVRDHYQQRGMAPIAQKLDRLRQFRNACDYEADIARLGDHFIQIAFIDARHILSKTKPPSK